MSSPMEYGAERMGERWTFCPYGCRFSVWYLSICFHYKIQPCSVSQKHICQLSPDGL